MSSWDPGVKYIFFPLSRGQLLLPIGRSKINFFQIQTVKVMVPYYPTLPSFQQIGTLIYIYKLKEKRHQTSVIKYLQKLTYSIHLLLRFHSYGGYTVLVLKSLPRMAPHR
jgi:hypothetical protein